MPNRSLKLFLIMIIVALLATGCGLLREPEEASGPIEAIPLELETETPEESVEVPPTAEAAAETTAAPPTSAPDEAQPEAYPPATLNEEPQAAYPEPGQEVSDGASAGGELRVYQIAQDASQVTFQLDEDLRGERITVVGSTDQVAGELALNLADLSTAQIGVIQINARTLLTDNNFRNRAIQNEILETGAYEFITFTPTAILDLPASAAVGQEVAFTVEGDLTIRDVTQPVSFQVVAVAQSETELTGQASTIVEREAFGLVIPQVRNVANVEEVVELTINFTARA